MKAITKRALTAILIFSAISTNAQNQIYDEITLKGNKGTIKGVINEQVLGENPTIQITPSEAILTINVEDVEGGKARVVKVDNTTYDVITLKGSGEKIMGDIISESIGKWYKISTTKLPQRRYSCSDISKLSKKFVNSEKSIYEMYGVYENVTLKGGTTISGVVVEQDLGTSITVEDKTDGKDKIIDISNILTIKKEGYNPNVDIFKQSAYIDVVQTKDKKFRGIIVSQRFGENVIVRLVDSGNCSAPIPYSQIVSISKEENTLLNQVAESSKVEVVKEEKDSPKEVKTTEVAEAAPAAKVEVAEKPVVEEKVEEVAKNTDEEEEVLEEEVLELSEEEMLGLYAYENKPNKFLESYRYDLSKNKQQIWFKCTEMELLEKFKVGGSYTFILKVKGSVESVISSFKVWALSIDDDTKARYIEVIPKKKKKDQATDVDMSNNVVIESSSSTSGTIVVTIKPKVAGEYAITYTDCLDIAVFKVE